MEKCSYNEIYSHFLRLVKEHDYANIEQDVAYCDMKELLYMSISNPFVTKIFSQIELDDEILLLTYELKYSTIEALDKQFVINVLARGMVVSWLEPYVNNTTNLLQMFGGKEEKFYSQDNHLKGLKSLLEYHEIKLKKILRDRGYAYNDYTSD